MIKSESFWDKTASKYYELEKKDEQTYFTIIEKTKPYLKTSDTVLDFGCGTGLITNEIAKYVKEIHAIDTSSKMIGIAERKAKERQIQNIDYDHVDIFDDRFVESSFDVILASYVLHLLEDEHMVIQRMKELLKPGGLLISVTPCLGEKKLLSGFLFMGSKINIVPKINSFNRNDLVNTFEEGNFSVIDTECLKKSSQEYFIVSKKIK
ncbi:class I SAM-dependent methyltransferase [Halalkalibacillus sediminis]|uniref:Class I SAM-dependent methyltransferase n=1 Tax=Halalkalibacillus sediminis TaxID=2018042 RepID=A0A2I0QSW3_9BACI|nr:class I SAM-dependent methyltransferase [Halalkalibacillus sediminis]PKR77398.1 class I SAM-dependent methyltransferase [Halalkalibacillus sediminis]